MASGNGCDPVDFSLLHSPDRKITFHSGNLYFCSASQCLSQLPTVLSQPSQKLICHSQVALPLKLVWCFSRKELLCSAGYTGLTATWAGACPIALKTMTLHLCPEDRENGCCINLLRTPSNINSKEY